MGIKARDIFNEWKFPVVIGLMLFGLVFSKWILSSSQFLLLFAVLSDRASRRNLAKAFSTPVVIALISLYLLHLAGLLWTDDFSYASKDLKTKLPLLVFPILFFAAGTMKRKTAEILLLSFVGLVFLLSAISLINFYVSPTVPKQVAIGQSHIRFSLMICFSVLILIHFAIQKMFRLKYFIVPVLGVLLYFLFILESFTGYAVFLFLLFALPFLYWKYLNSKIVRISSVGVLFLIAALSIWGYLDVRKSCFPAADTRELTGLETSTANGNSYHHDTTNTLTENGHYVYIYIAEEEMVEAWNARSDKPLTDTETIYEGRKNQLVRYLASKGLRKDSAGVYALNDQDIRKIESGYPNYRLTDFDPYRERIYRFLWEWNVYKICNDPSGHSLTQRFEYWKAAVNIISRQPWLGTGTGDIANAFTQEYDSMKSHLQKEYRLRAHNQFLSIAVAFGLVGLCVFLFSLAAPFVLSKIPDTRLYIGFIFIFLLSLLNEDTLETQVGVTFYALFNSFLLFIMPFKNKPGDENKRT